MDGTHRWEGRRHSRQPVDKSHTLLRPSAFVNRVGPASSSFVPSVSDSNKTDTITLRYLIFKQHMEYGQKATRLPKTTEEKLQWERAVFVLEHCPLMSTQSERGWELVCQRHRNALARKKVTAAEMRPDVVHQVLLHLLDSPLNRAGKLQIFLHTIGGVLITIDPRLRVPRSYRLFEKMMCMLLHKMKIRSTVNSIALMKIVKNPVTDHLPVHAKYIRMEVDGMLADPFELCRRLAQSSRPTKRSAFEHSGDVAVNAEDAGDAASSSSSSGLVDPRLEPLFAPNTTTAFQPFVFVVGGTARGNVEVSYAGAGLAKPPPTSDSAALEAAGQTEPTTAAGRSKDFIPRLDEVIRDDETRRNAAKVKKQAEGFSVKVSARSLSAAAACSVLCHALETAWLDTA